MTLKSYTGVAAFGLLSICRMAAAQDNLVINGSFSGNANGWTITDTPGGFGYHPVAGNPGGGVQLDNINPSPTSDPTASQTISGLTPGIVYLLSGDYQQGKVRGSNLPSDPSFGVSMDDNLLFTALAPGDFVWRRFSFPYTAASSTSLLRFSSQINGTGVSWTIDNIDLRAVPEPGCVSLGLFSFGLLMCSYRIQRSGSI